MLNHAFRVWLLCAVLTRNYTNSGKRPAPRFRFLGDCVAQSDAQQKERKCRKVTNANGGPDQARRRVSVTEDKRNSSP